MKPFLRWAGSKKQLLPTLLSMLPRGIDRYIEPFAGSACLFFEMQPQCAVLGDLSWELVTTYRTLRNDVDAVISELSKLRRGAQTYYRLRSWNPNTLALSKLAARFIYLNRFCFNGLYRTNEQGQFNVPYGHNKSKNDFDFAHLRSVARLLKRATLHVGDFSDTLRNARKGDFVYLDPPYVVKRRRIFREYGVESFCADDLHRLDKSLGGLDRRGIKFVVSYAYCREAKVLFSPWCTRRVLVRRNIAGFCAARRSAYELLAWNF